MNISRKRKKPDNSKEKCLAVDITDLEKWENEDFYEGITVYPENGITERIYLNRQS